MILSRHAATGAFAEGVAGLLARDPHSLPGAVLVADTERLLTLKRQFDGVLARSCRPWMPEMQRRASAAGRLGLGLLKLPDPDVRDHAEKELLDAARYTDPTLMARGLRKLADL